MRISVQDSLTQRIGATIVCILDGEGVGRQMPEETAGEQNEEGFFHDQKAVPGPSLCFCVESVNSSYRGPARDFRSGAVALAKADHIFPKIPQVVPTAADKDDLNHPFSRDRRGKAL